MDMSSLTNFFRKLVERANDVGLVIVVDVTKTEDSKKNDEASGRDRHRIVSV